MLLDLAASCSTTGEGDLANLHMGSDQLAGLARTVDDVDGSGWEDLLDHRAESEDAERGFLRGLVDEGISSSQGGLPSSAIVSNHPWETYSSLPSKQNTGDIPRANTRTNANRLTLGNLILARRIRIRRLTMYLIRQTSVISKQIRHDAVRHGLQRHGRAHSLSIQTTELLGLGADQVSELDHAGRARGRVHLAPFALEGGFGGGHGGIDICFTGGVDLIGDEVVVGGVVDSEGFAGFGVDVLRALLDHLQLASGEGVGLPGC